MSTLKNTLLLTALSLTLNASLASAQQVTVEAAAGPLVSIDGAPQTTHLALGASRSFEMLSGFRGLEAARAISGRLMARGRGLASPLDLTLVPSTDGERFEYVDATDPSAFVMVNANSGDISFCRGMQGFEVEVDTANLLRGDEATRAAIDHLKRLRLMPRNSNEMVVHHIGGLRMSQRNEDGTTADYDKLTSVHFGRTLDGLAVGGPGSKIIVHLGANGELVGMQRRWIEVRAAENDAQSFLGAGEALESIEGHLRREWSEAQTVRSESPTPGLYDDGRGRIEPALFFRAELSYDEELHEFARGEYTRDYLGVVSALRNGTAKYAQLELAAVSPSKAADMQIPQEDGGNE